MAAVSPIDGDTTDFTTRTHARALKDVFGIFDQDIMKRAQYQMVDKCSLKLSIAKALEVPHIWCVITNYL